MARIEPTIDIRVAEWIEQLSERFGKTGVVFDLADWLG